MSRHSHNPLIQMLCIDQSTGNWSNTKLWANIGYAILCYAFVYQCITAAASTELYLTFGGLLLGNRTLNKYLSQKKEETNVSSKHPEET